MSNEIELVSDGDGMAVIGDSSDVERFLLDQGLGKTPSKVLDVQRLSSFAGTSGAVLRVGSDVAVSLARVMGPPDCQGDGTTVARY